jgi:hypothetical protein
MLARIGSALVAVWLVCTGMSAAGAKADDNQVDLLLVLAADVSHSVDAAKFELQREGYAAAMTDPRVIKAMTGGTHRRIALCFIEWADDYEQSVIVDWTLIADADDAHGVARTIREAPRSHAGRTSIGAGIDYAMAQLARTQFQSPRRVIDVSGDGTSNADRTLAKAREEALALGVTINGLAILSSVPLAGNPKHTHPPGGLTAYYRDNVIGGPEAFVVEAQDFDAFGQALIAKLIKEIADTSASVLQRIGHRTHPRQGRIPSAGGGSSAPTARCEGRACALAG